MSIFCTGTGIYKFLSLQDMGLGKTLTVISLILTNFHDGRPLCKPEIGYIRRPIEAVRSNRKGGRRKADPINGPDLSKVGSKIKKNTEKTSAFSFFDKFKVKEIQPRHVLGSF
jgi:SNF2 family DNA or RNA helicase